MSDRTPTVERGTNHFNLEVKYSPEAIFGRLTYDDLPHSFILENNLPEIRKHNVTPILTLEAKVISDYPDTNIKGQQPPLVASFKADMDFRTQIDGIKPKDFGPYFARAGLEVEYREIKNPNEGDIPQSFYISPEGAPHPVKIRMFDVSYGTYTILMSSPPIDTSLTDPEKFDGDQAAFFGSLQKVVEAVYDMEGKELPSKELVFKEKNTNTAFAVQCTYCRRMYSASQSFECSGCGASEPFTEEGKVKYFN